jgi:hypothetical protein
LVTFVQKGDELFGLIGENEHAMTRLDDDARVQVYSPMLRFAVWQGSTVRWPTRLRSTASVELPWTPEGFRGLEPHFDWAGTGGVLEFAGISGETLLWSRVEVEDDRLRLAGNAASSQTWVAMAMIRTGRLVGVDTNGRVHWLQPRRTDFTKYAISVPLPTPEPVVAAFAHLPRNEAIIVLQSGRVARLRLPAG